MSKLSRRAFTAAAIGTLGTAARGFSRQDINDDPDFIEQPRENLYQERDWNESRDGQINLSGFVFRDIDGDGQYSVGDLPHYGTYVQMQRPDGEVFLRQSNRNGFSNFAASITRDDAVINMPGEYEFEVIPPTGWHITTGNAVQTVQVVEAHGSIGGYIMDFLPDPFGISPDLQIRGNLPALLDSMGEVEIFARNHAGQEIPIEPGDDGQFAIGVERGEWEIVGSRGGTPARLVNVDVHPVVLSGVADRFTSEERARATVLGFDDIASGSTLRKVPNGYGGLNWSGLNAMSNQFGSGGEGYTNCTQSGEYLSYSSSGLPVIISREAGFDFVGGYFGVAWPTAEGETIRARAFRNDTLIAEDAFSGSSYGSVYFQADYRAITRLELTTDHSWQFVVDDIEIIVPE